MSFPNRTHLTRAQGLLDPVRAEMSIEAAAGTRVAALQSERFGPSYRCGYLEQLIVELAEGMYLDVPEITRRRTINALAYVVECNLRDLAQWVEAHPDEIEEPAEPPHTLDGRRI